MEIMDWISTLDVNEFINFSTKFALCTVIIFAFFDQLIDVFLDAFVFNEYNRTQTIVKYMVMIGLVGLIFIILRW